MGPANASGAPCADTCLLDLYTFFNEYQQPSQRGTTCQQPKEAHQQIQHPYDARRRRSLQTDPQRAQISPADTSFPPSARPDPVHPRSLPALCPSRSAANDAFNNAGCSYRTRSSRRPPCLGAVRLQGRGVGVSVAAACLAGPTGGSCGRHRGCGPPSSAFSRRRRRVGERWRGRWGSLVLSAAAAAAVVANHQARTEGGGEAARPQKFPAFLARECGEEGPHGGHSEGRESSDGQLLYLGLCGTRSFHVLALVIIEWSRVVRKSRRLRDVALSDRSCLRSFKLSLVCRRMEGDVFVTCASLADKAQG